jgi:hypothetical protein
MRGSLQTLLKKNPAKPTGVSRIPQKPGGGNPNELVLPHSGADSQVDFETSGAGKVGAAAETHEKTGSKSGLKRKQAQDENEGGEVRLATSGILRIPQAEAGWQPIRGNWSVRDCWSGQGCNEPSAGGLGL